MKVVVISDIHGSEYYMKRMEEIINKVNPDKVILLGDLYYHGPRNTLTKEYNPQGVCKILNNMKDKILCCKGNCDAEVDEMISEFKFEQNIKLEINGKRFFFTHGHVYNLENIPDTDYLVLGHFHTGYIKDVNGVTCINSGSISLPKENTPNSYIEIIEDTIYLKDLDGNIIDSKYID